MDADIGDYAPDFCNLFVGSVAVDEAARLRWALDSRLIHVPGADQNEDSWIRLSEA